MQESFDLTKFIFGRLGWDAIPLHEPILIATFAGVIVGGDTSGAQLLLQFDQIERGRQQIDTGGGLLCDVRQVPPVGVA